MKTIQSVRGPVAAGELGVTLPHEHVLVDLRRYWAAPREVTRLRRAEAPVDIRLLGWIRRDPLGSRDNLILDDLAAAAAELAEYRALGGTTLVDLGLPEIGRDVQALRAAASLSGVQIIASSGHYVGFAHPPELAQLSVDDLAERFVLELEHGIGDTGIRAGVLGEIGTSVPLDPAEEKVVRAAARAQRRTGAPIVVHLSPPPKDAWYNAHEVLDVLDSEGAEPRGVLLSHLANALGAGDEFDRAIGYHCELAARGCWLGYDGCGKEYYLPGGSRANYGNFWCPSDEIRAKAIGILAERGLIGQILLSQDVCFKIELQRFGGFGYGHILRTFSRNLADNGVDNKALQRILVENTSRFLCPDDG